MTHITDSEHRQKQDNFMLLYQPCHARFARFCRAISRNNEDAKDLMADTVLEAFEKFANLRLPESFLYFLFGMAVRINRKKLRRLKFRGIFNQEKAENIKDYSANPEISMELTLLLEAMQKLPLEHREALTLFEISGLSLKEIQEIQGVSLSAVKARISRARQKLSKLLKVEDDHSYSEPSIKQALNNLKTLPILL